MTFKGQHLNVHDMTRRIIFTWVIIRSRRIPSRRTGWGIYEAKSNDEIIIRGDEYGLVAARLYRKVK